MTSPQRVQRASGHLAKITCCYVIVWICLCLLGPTAPAFAQERFISFINSNLQRVVVAPGRTLTIETDLAISDIVVGDPQIADVFPLSGNSLYIQGKNSGSTNISIYDANQNLLGAIAVRVRIDYAELRQAIRDAVPSARVDVVNINDRIRLSGVVKNSVDLRRVLEIGEQYSSEPVLNALRIQDAQQVLLNVRILEVQRNSGRELGVNLTGTKNRQTRLDTGLAASSNAPFGTFVGSLLQIAGIDIDFVINALEAKGVARRLANPSMVTKSGVEANFVVGGEVPIQTTATAENGTVATETSYREYGVRLNFLPFVLDNGLINVRIRPEVSEIDFSVNVNGNPGFITRKADTTVELRDGQSFAIAGLLQTDNSRNIKQLPWIGQLPVLGALFRSSAFQKRETDLVILVTPRIVQPTPPGMPLVSPLDGPRSSDDVELFLLGMLEVNKSLIRSFHNGGGLTGPYGHIIDLEFENNASSNP